MECSQCFREMASISAWILHFKWHSHLLIFLISSGPSQGLLTLSLHPGFDTTHLSWAFTNARFASPEAESALNHACLPALQAQTTDLLCLGAHPPQ